MNSRSTRRLIKAKSQEVLDTSEGPEIERPLSPSGGTGFVSKMKKVLGTYSSPLEKRITQSLKTLSQGPTFGVPIEDLLQRSSTISLQIPAKNSANNSSVPHIVSKIIDHIELHGLKQEGIYRVNGNARIMDSIKMSFDKVGDAELNNKDIYSVGGVLKLFLRQLPISLIPDEEIDEIVELQEANNGLLSHNGLMGLRVILKKMPESHYSLLKTLCRHLLYVSGYSEENKMTPVSLSIVFGPSVMKCGGGLDGLKKQGSVNSAFAKMIQNYSTVFEDDSLPSVKHTELSRESSFGSRFKRVRKKPKKPEAYHKHMAQKLGQDQHKPSSTSDPNPNDTMELDEERATTPERRNKEGDTSMTVDEAIDQAFEAVIKEDLEAGAKRQRKSENWLASFISTSRPKGSFQSDDLTNRVSSPYSWRSSPGTSPSTSPVVTPRTSQAYTTLIGDAIQENLFDSQTMTTSFSTTSTQHQDTASIISSNPSSTHIIPYRRLVSSPELSSEQMNEVSEGGEAKKKSGPSEQPEVREGAVIRRNRMTRNRKSAIYGEGNFQPSESIESGKKKFVSVGDLNVHLVTVNDRGQDNNGNGGNDSVTSRTGTVSHLVKQLSDQDKKKEKDDRLREWSPPSDDNSSSVNSKETAEEKSVTPEVLKPDSTGNEVPLEFSEPVNKKQRPAAVQPLPTLTKLTKEKPELPPPPNLVSLQGRGETANAEGRVNEFDYVMRSNGALFHPTLQRVRVPFKRARPSRRSMILKKGLENKAEDRGIESRKKNTTPSASPERRVKQERNASVSSITSVSTVSRLGSLSSPPDITPDNSPVHAKPHIVTLMQMETIVDDEREHEIAKDVGDREEIRVLKTGVAPEDKPAIAKAWTKGDLDVPDLGLSDSKREDDHEGMSYQEMLKLAQKLRTTIREFEDGFFTKYGRKPTEEERSSVRDQIHTLTSLKKKLKAIKATEAHLSKTVPASVGKHIRFKSDEVQESLASFSATKLDGDSPNLEKRAKGVHRHHSLLMHASREQEKKDGNPLVSVQRKILSLLSERRARDNRPEDLNKMTFEQLMDEKQSVQKMLLHFERKHGRPQTSGDKDIMRPVYDRYREIKRHMSTNESRRKALNLSSNEVFSSTVTDSTLGSVSILQSSLVHTMPTTTGGALDSRTSLSKTPLALLGPSSFVLPLSPSRHSNEYSRSGTTKERQSSLSPAHNTFSSLSSGTESIKNQSTSILQPSVRTGGRGVSKSASASAVVMGGGGGTDITSDQLKKASVSELNNLLKIATTKKKQIGKELRLFENGFEEKYGRPLQREDKKLKYQQYMEYRMIKSRISEINEILDARLSLQKTTQQ